MRALFRILTFAVVGAAAAAACSLDTEGGLDGDPDGGGGVGGGTGGSGASVQCWGAEYKICDGECVTVDDAAYGCGSTACSPCNLPNANAKCVGNACEIDTCSAGYQDCDVAQLNHHATGCETNTNGDPANCGSCGEQCYLRNPGLNWTCDNGVCRESNCALGKADCDMQGECETSTDADPNNCGFCGNVCNLPNAVARCAAAPQPQIGVCEIDQCNPGFADCDTSAPNHHATGCEVNITNDTANCGACGVTCPGPTAGNGFPTCVNGSCGITCGSGQILCGTECRDPNTLQNCGSCNNVCGAPAGGTAQCVNQQCTFICNGGLTKCGNSCVNTTNDPLNCGNCNNICPGKTNGSPICSGSACDFTCNAGYDKCNNNCVNYQTSNNHCGSCGNPCNNERICTAGSCQCPAAQPKACPSSCEPQCCPGGSGDCTNPKVCGSGGTCVCPAGTITCGASNCCSGGKVCQAGSCVCPSGKKDCGNGQCVDCCGGDCGVGETCTSGSCVCDGSHPKDCGNYCATECCNAGDCTGPPTGQECKTDGTCGCPMGQKDCSGVCQVCCGNGDCGGSEKCCNGTCIPNSQSC